MKNSDYVLRFEFLKQTRLTHILHSTFFILHLKKSITDNAALSLVRVLSENYLSACADRAEGEGACYQVLSSRQFSSP